MLNYSVESDVILLEQYEDFLGIVFRMNEPVQGTCLNFYWRYVEKKARNMWPNEYFLNEELFPLKRYRFGKTYVNGPNKLFPYCERSWGNWKKGKTKLWKGLINPILLYKTWTYKM